ncbi:MAG: NAD(P)H-binding protein, partial [Spirochaetia bacterium]
MSEEVLTAGRVFQDSLDAAEIVRQPGLDWTVVRAPRLTEKPASGSYRASNSRSTRSKFIYYMKLWP